MTATEAGVIACECRAWVNFNGTGVVAIVAGSNVSSVTDNGVGDYTINFTTAMRDANYAFAGSVRKNSDVSGGNAGIMTLASASKTASAVRIYIGTGWSTPGVIDSTEIHVMVFR